MIYIYIRFFLFLCFVLVLNWIVITELRLLYAEVQIHLVTELDFEPYFEAEARFTWVTILII